MACFIEEGEFERHLRRMRLIYAKRYKTIIEVLNQSFGDRINIIGTQAGLHILVRFPGMSYEQLERLIQQAAAHKVDIYSARNLYQKPGDDADMLLGFAVLDEDQIRQGIKILHQCWKALSY